MFLSNERNEQIEIEGFVVSDTPEVTTLLCKGAIPENFLTDKITAQYFIMEVFMEHTGEPYATTNFPALYPDQFLLALHRD